MAEFSYAKGRIEESLQFIAREVKEFNSEYAAKTWQEYQKDGKLQKLMERTIENILTALIEICGTLLAEKGIAAENYSEVLKKAGQIFGFSEQEQADFAKLAAQRNRMAHRYLDYKWEGIQFYKEQNLLIQKFLKQLLK